MTNLADLSRDLLDVFITYYIFYRVALVLKGTRGMQVVLGLVLVFFLYVVAEVLRLRTVLTLLTAVLSSAILIGVVVFQNDIRRGLMRVGARARFGAAQHPQRRVLDDVVDAATTLARHRTGAIITFEQAANLDEFVGSHTGHVIDAAVSSELLVSLFVPEGMNKLHDGAVIIRDLRIAKAGVFFPMPQSRVSDSSYGSRHRAAIGISEETDAIVIIVSEERGSISFCFNGNITSNLDGPKLRAALDGIFAPKPAATMRGRWWPVRPTADTQTAPMVTPSVATASQPPAPPPLAAPVEAPPTETPPASERSPAPLRKLNDDGDPQPKPLRLTTDQDDEPSDESPPKPLRKNPDRGSERPPAPLRRNASHPPETLPPIAGDEGALRIIPTPLRHMVPQAQPSKRGSVPPNRPTRSSEFPGAIVDASEEKQGSRPMPSPEVKDGSSSRGTPIPEAQDGSAS